jgi:hypothetical protein
VQAFRSLQQLSTPFADKQQGVGIRNEKVSPLNTATMHENRQNTII